MKGKKASHMVKTGLISQQTMNIAANRRDFQKTPSISDSYIKPKMYKLE